MTGSSRPHYTAQKHGHEFPQTSCEGIFMGKGTQGERKCHFCSNEWPGAVASVAVRAVTKRI